jgi:formate--tetrahydrofolate ligase
MKGLGMSQSVAPRHIFEVAQTLGIHSDDLMPFGRYKAKVNLDLFDRLQGRPTGRYILVSAINPTPLGEGKTTTAIGIGMGLTRLGHKAVVTLRQPSLGPVFGIKGGGAGGGRAQLYPMEDINLHLTGDAHAVASSHNLLSAFVDNHIFHGNSLTLDPQRIVWPRVTGISDRALREISLKDGAGRTGRFVITEASEVMAILALARNAEDLRRRLAQILIGFTSSGRPVRADELGCVGAMTVLLKDALLPNLVQTVEGTPAFVHTGPFGNIAHGNCSIVSDAIALRCADYVITEAGFGSDLGAEKFFNIKCRVSGFRPSAAVVVATLRALKLHGDGVAVKSGAPLPDALTGPNEKALAKGFANLEQHIANVRAYGIPVVVAVNAFTTDPPVELEWVRERSCKAGAFDAMISTHWADGGRGAEQLADAVLRAARHGGAFTQLYDLDWPIRKKIETIATRMYGAAGVSFEPEAEEQMETAGRLGYGKLPICMAKTPLSLSHDPTLKGRPSGFILPIKELRILAGAGFLTAVCSGMQLLPGLPKRPAGERIDLDVESGKITGLA